MGRQRQRKLCLRLMNRLNSLKHVQHSDAHNSNQKKEKEKKKKENILFTTFWNFTTCLKEGTYKNGVQLKHLYQFIPMQECLPHDF